MTSILMRSNKHVLRPTNKSSQHSFNAAKSLISNKNLRASTKNFKPILSQITSDLITDKSLKTSNLLINIFEANIKDISVYIIDFKCFRISKETLTIILDEMKKVPMNQSDKFLMKIGYNYDSSREMLSLIYYKGTTTLFNVELIFKRRQTMSASEDQVKLSIINDFLSLYRDQKQLMANNLFHPSLLFFLDKEGLMYYDNVLGIIYANCRECITPICLPYFGVIEHISINNRQGFIVCCLLIYFFANAFCDRFQKKRQMSYDEIVYRFKMDLCTKKKDFAYVLREVEEDRMLQLKTLLTSANLYREGGGLTRTLEAFSMFYKEIITFSTCSNCAITTNQLSANHFMIHYPCYNILCNKCLPLHDCKLAILKELGVKEKKLLQEKEISILLSKKETTPYSKEYEKIISNLYGDFKSDLYERIRRQRLYEKEKENMFMIIMNEQKDAFQSLRLKYKEMIQDQRYKDSSLDIIQLKNLLTKMEEKNQIIAKLYYIFFSHGIEQFEQMKYIKGQFNEICSMMKKDIFRQLDELLCILHSKCKAFLHKYQFDSLIDEFCPTDFYNKLSIYVKKSNTIHCYDFTTMKNTEITPIYTIPVNCSTINLKSMFLIVGGHVSKATYCLSYTDNMDDNQKGFTQLADLNYFHMFHSLIRVGFNYVYCISGSTTAKNESYNLFTNEWKTLPAELHKPYSNTGLFLYNHVDLFIFFGEYIEKKMLRPSYDVLCLELFVDKAQWEKKNFIPPDDFVPMYSFGVVPLNDKNILIVGGMKINKDEELVTSSAIYKFNFEFYSLKREEGALNNHRHGITFGDCNFYDISEGKVANWGDNLKMIKMNRNPIQSKFS